MRLASSPGVEDYPIWTPDGKRIVFSSQRDATYGLYWQAADGTRRGRAIDERVQGAGSGVGRA